VLDRRALERADRPLERADGGGVLAGPDLQAQGGLVVGPEHADAAADLIHQLVDGQQREGGVERRLELAGPRDEPSRSRTSRFAHGDNARDVIAMWRRGLGPERAVRTVTADAARVCRVDDRCGALRPGLAAEVVVVGGYALTDLERLRDVRLVVQDGGVAHRAGRDG
jgi:hypothetical protein